jgi:hypothetical protein
MARVPRIPAVVAACLVTLGVAACTSSSTRDARTSGSQTTAPAQTTKGVTTSGASTVTGCPNAATAGTFSVNIQLVAQFAQQTSVTQWSNTLGALDQLADEIKALKTLSGANVQADLALFEQADVIVQRGLGGDATAQHDLTALLGTDLAKTLQKKNDVLLAYNQQCQS